MQEYELIISSQAIQDLDDIWIYIAEYNIKTADKVVTRFYEKCLMLTQFPESGKLREELFPNIRQVHEKNYSVFYQIEEQQVKIARILRSNRDFKRHL